MRADHRGCPSELETAPDQSCRSRVRVYRGSTSFRGETRECIHNSRHTLFLEKRQGREMVSEMRRTAFQGLTNIIRFNWPFYAVSVASVLAAVMIFLYTTGPFR